MLPFYLKTECTKDEEKLKNATEIPFKLKAIIDTKCTQKMLDKGILISFGATSDVPGQ